tara:strand:- start:52 stop:696 length:645 start_codon:yes stop_codon:yes gene_type:complete
MCLELSLSSVTFEHISLNTLQLIYFTDRGFSTHSTFTYLTSTTSQEIAISREVILADHDILPITLPLFLATYRIRLTTTTFTKLIIRASLYQRKSREISNTRIHTTFVTDLFTGFTGFSFGDGDLRRCRTLPFKTWLVLGAFKRRISRAIKITDLQVDTITNLLAWLAHLGNVRRIGTAIQDTKQSRKGKIFETFCMTKEHHHSSYDVKIWKLF